METIKFELCKQNITPLLYHELESYYIGIQHTMAIANVCELINIHTGKISHIKKDIKQVLSSPCQMSFMFISCLN